MTPTASMPLTKAQVRQGIIHREATAHSAASMVSAQVRPASMASITVVRGLMDLAAARQDLTEQADTPGRIILRGMTGSHIPIILTGTEAHPSRICSGISSAGQALLTPVAAAGAA